MTTPIRHPWFADAGDGTYRNPILCADYSDPDVVRDGDDFWMTASSFNCTPGLPILHSRDLVNWTLVNHAIKNLPDPRGVYDIPQHGCGVWAPAIRKHAGKFWIFFPQVDEGIYVTTATDPREKWSEPHMLVEGKGLIDPCPLWDDDGKAYLVHAYARSRSGIKHRLRVRPMGPDASKVLGDGEIVFDDPEKQPTLEGPKFHKRDGFYYISAPAGGVASGWQLILRAKSVYGPYEPKVVLEQGSTPINGPHQGAIVDAADGKEWWFVHFQEAQPYGRIVHLQPVQWKDGWPLMGIDHDGNGVGEPVLRHRKPAVAGKHAIAAPQTSDEFDGEKLGLQWQWHANHREDWHSLTARPGHLRLGALSTAEDFKLVANLLLQKFPARQFAAETEVELGDAAGAGAGAGAQAGLILMGNSHAALMVANSPEHPQLLYIVDNKIATSQPLKSRRVRLRVDVADGGACEFSFADGGGGGGATMKRIGERFQSMEGKWIGAKVGVCCRSPAAGDAGGAGDARGVGGAGDARGFADFDYFRFS